MIQYTFHIPFIFSEAKTALDNASIVPLQVGEGEQPPERISANC